MRKLQGIEAVVERHWRRLWAKGRDRSPSIVEFLASVKYIDELIRQLRNVAVHARPETITPGEAIEFKELSERLIFHRERAFKQAEVGERKKSSVS